MLYNNDFEIDWLVKDRISSFLREADQEWQLSGALEGTTQKNPYSHRFLAWLGGLLMQWGKDLQNRYSCCPGAAPSTNSSL